MGQSRNTGRIRRDARVGRRGRKLYALGLSAAALAGLAACGTDDNGARAAGAIGDYGIDCSGAGAVAGSSAQKNAMDRFAAAYVEACGDAGARLAYTPSGSGDGRTQFAAGQTDFGGSDSAIIGEQKAQAARRCDGGEVWNLPMVFGPVAIAYNLPGVDGLVLDAPTLARIFSGAVTEWDDPAIAALNPQTDLPAEGINVVYRSDSSGTTDNFQTYLQTASDGAWTAGAGSEFAGGVGNGSKGSAGVTNAVGRTEGAITYVESSYARKSGLQTASIDSGAGPVALTPQTASAAVAQAELARQGGKDMTLDLTSIYGTEAPGAYPLVLATYEIVCAGGYDARTADAVRTFLTVAAGPGQDGLGEIGYVPLPENIRAELTDAIDSISAG